MKTQHEVLMEDPEFRRLLAIESLVAEAAESIARMMAEQNLSKADLARRLKKSRSWVTQLLSGETNMTIHTLADVMYALDGEVKLHIQPSSHEAGKPHPAESQAVVFKMDQYRLEAPMVENLFRLQDHQLRSSQEDLATVLFEVDPESQEYAA
jgi:transcriptional regulator with XRE-family HTH domain